MTEPRDTLPREAEIVAEYWLDAQQTNAHDALLNLAHAFALVEQERAASPTPDHSPWRDMTPEQWDKAASPTPDALDVEALAEAVHVGCTRTSGVHDLADGPDDWDRELAQAYAERYAAILAARGQK